MYDVAFNYKHQGNNAENLWMCSSCQSAIESQDHVLFCPAYAQLRQGKNLDSDRDLSDYLMKVLIIREKLKISKWGAPKPPQKVFKFSVTRKLTINLCRALPQDEIRAQPSTIVIVLCLDIDS